MKKSCAYIHDIVCMIACSMYECIHTCTEHKKIFEAITKYHLTERIILTEEYHIPQIMYHLIRPFFFTSPNSDLGSGENVLHSAPAHSCMYLQLSLSA